MVFSLQNDPIIAVATAPGRGAVGIVRISGNDLDRLFTPFFGQKLRPREATLLSLKNKDAQVIDQGLVIFFPGPNSYTGEDVVELQVHGGPVVLQLLMDRCFEVAAQTARDGKPILKGLRLAQPGEFTQRAFLNDKLDLAQAEAVADLINANTEMAARSAARSIAGEFSRWIEHLQLRLTKLRMLVEATLDFPEEDIDFIERDDAQGQAQEMLQLLGKISLQAQQGALLREGITVVIAGQPNAGKSSLLNMLAERDVAIVTAIPGTTRDKVSEQIQIKGIPLHIIDTAGLRQTQDEVERIGIERTWQEIKGADAVIFLHDLSRLDDSQYWHDETSLHQEILTQIGQNVPLLEVYNKLDLVSQDKQKERENAIFLSAKTGQGIEFLQDELLRQVGWQAMPEGVYLARTRHVQALHKTEQHLEHALHLLSQKERALELIAEELRLAQNSLGEITGEFSVEDLLGVIFSEFCIGK